MTSFAFFFPPFASKLVNVSLRAATHGLELRFVPVSTLLDAGNNMVLTVLSYSAVISISLTSIIKINNSFF